MGSTNKEKHGKPERSDLAAGRYGELTNCDMPLETAEKQLIWLRDNLKDSRKPDLILWTGDSVSHQMLDISKDDVYKTIEALTAMVERLMPDIPFVVSIGNHDFEPANYQEFKEKNSEYLGNLAKIWEGSFLGQ